LEHVWSWLLNWVWLWERDQIEWLRLPLWVLLMLHLLLLMEHGVKSLELRMLLSVWLTAVVVHLDEHDVVDHFAHWSLIAELRWILIILLIPPVWETISMKTWLVWRLLDNLL